MMLSTFGKKNLRQTSVGLVAALALYLAVPSAANAGFEWTPPPAAAKGNSGPEIKASPMPPVDAYQLDTPMPHVTPQMQNPLQIKNFPFEQQVGGTADYSDAGSPLVPPPVPVAATPPMVGDDAAMTSGQMPTAHIEFSEVPPVVTGPEYEVIHGFGNDIPLALAMRQIVPASYAYSFDNGVDPGTRVNWSGSRSWDKVIEDAVAPLGMAVAIVGNTVWIREASQVRYEAAANKPMVPDMLPVSGGPVMPMHAENAMVPMPGVMGAPAAPSFPSAASVMKPQAVPAYGVAQPVPNAPQSLVPAPAPMDAREGFVHRSSPQDSAQLTPAQIRGDNYSPSYPRRTPAGVPSMTAPAPMMAPVVSPLQPAPQAAAMPTGYPPGFMPEGSAQQQRVANTFAPQPFAPEVPVERLEPAMLKQAPAMKAMDPMEIGYWEAEAGESLRNVLGRWSGEAGVQMLWGPAKDYPLSMAIKMHGTYSDAVTQALLVFAEASQKPVGQLYPNLPNGPSVLIIKDYSAMTN